MPTPYEGGCLCRAIRYRATAEPVARTLCHCRSCRLASGAPSLAWTVFRASDFEWLAGTPREFSSSAGVVRTFCGDCGTSIGYARDTRADVVDVTTASLDEPDGCAPSFEIWTSHKLAWEATNPALAQFPRSSHEGGSG